MCRSPWCVGQLVNEAQGRDLRKAETGVIETMSLKIRLARGGAKKRPFYRIVVADSRSPRDGRFIEKIGTYDPMLAKDHPDRIRFDADRAKYWLGVGAKASDRVHRFLAEADLMGARAVPDQTKKSQPKAKAQEREAERAEKAKAAAEDSAETAAEESAEAAAEESTEAVAEDSAEAASEETKDAAGEEAGESADEKASA